MKCEECVFWVKRVAMEEGRCRRFPPQIFDDTPYGIFPITFPDEWCGEFYPETGDLVQKPVD